MKISKNTQKLYSIELKTAVILLLKRNNYLQYRVCTSSCSEINGINSRAAARLMTILDSYATSCQSTNIRCDYRYDHRYFDTFFSCNRYSCFR